MFVIILTSYGKIIVIAAITIHHKGVLLLFSKNTVLSV